MTYLDELEARADLVREKSGKCSMDVFLDNVRNGRFGLIPNNENLAFADMSIFRDEVRLGINQLPTPETIRLRRVNMGSVSWQVMKTIERTDPYVGDLGVVLTKYQDSTRPENRGLTTRQSVL